MTAASRPPDDTPPQQERADWPTRLVAHGFTKRCEVCEKQRHAKWHTVARGELNPVALLQFVERQRGNAPSVVDAIQAYVAAVAGIDVLKMETLLKEER